MDLGDVCLNRNAMQEILLKFFMAGGILMQTQVSQRHYPGCHRAAFRYARTAAYAERSRFLFWKPQAEDCPDNSYDNKKYLSHIGTRRQKAWNDTEKRTY